ncbi:hypothetical protein JXA88_18010 [Candidatus Fermentibacteria bacterium]|nr:hypothetical protein [Candidatus Fermentibacteria bacterium]
MMVSLLLLFCSLCGGLAPLRAAEPAPDLNDLAAGATSRLDEGFSFEPETLWGDLRYLKVLRDTVTVGPVYESLDRSGCGSCAHLVSGIDVVGSQDWLIE